MYTRIEVPLDGSPLAEKALPCAIGLAHQLQAQLLLVGVCELPIGVLYLREHERELLNQTETYLANLKQTITSPAFEGQLPPQQVQVQATIGKPAQEIIEIAQLEKVDLIVMSTHGLSHLSRLVLGSVANEVLRHSPIPVVLLRPTELDSEPLTINTMTASATTSKELRPVVVALDGSARAEVALEPALALAHQFGTKLFLLRVMPPRIPFVPYDKDKEFEKLEEEAYQYLDKLEETILSKDGLCTKVVRVGDPVTEIVDYTHQAQPGLLVMATHARGRVGEVMLGSVATEVVRQSHQPALLIHSVS